MRSSIPVLFSMTVAIGGCTSSPSVTVTPAQIASIEVSVTEAEKLAKAYTDLPLCPAAPACSAPATRAIVISDAHKAHDLVLALRIAGAARASAALAAVQKALAVLTTDIPTAH